MLTVDLPFMIAFNSGAIAGAIAWGRLSETRLGRRGAAGLATLMGMAATPLFLFAASAPLRLAGAAAMGFFGTGNFGIAPGYLGERVPTAARAAGTEFAYQSGAALASFAPTLIGGLHDRGMPLGSATAPCIIAAGAAGDSLGRKKLKGKRQK